MMSEINVKYMSDDTIETLRVNVDKYVEKFINNPKDSSWINDLTNEDTFVTKKFKIKKFELEIPNEHNMKEVEIRNSIKLYESLKHLPMYVLTEEKFWNWINFEIAYEYANILMPITKSNSIVKNHWLFIAKRRGLFYGVMSGCFFRVFLTVDDTKEDPYELTRFAINKYYRVSQLFRSTFTNEKKIVLGTLEAKKRVLEEFGDVESQPRHQEIAKEVSKLGSVKLIDTMSKEDISNEVYDIYTKIIIRDFSDKLDEK